MTYGPSPAAFVLDRCVQLRAKIVENDAWQKHPEMSARYGRLGVLEDLARHVAKHRERENDERGWDPKVPRVLYISPEDFVLIA